MVHGEELNPPEISGPRDFPKTIKATKH